MRAKQCGRSARRLGPGRGAGCQADMSATEDLVGLEVAQGLVQLRSLLGHPAFCSPDMGELVSAQRKFRQYLCAVRRERPDGPVAALNLLALLDKWRRSEDVSNLEQEEVTNLLLKLEAGLVADSRRRAGVF